MDTLNLTDANITTEYQENTDTWTLTATGTHFKGQADLKYEAVLAATKEIGKVIQQVQPALGSLLELNFDYHKDRKGTIYLDFRKKDCGVVSDVLIDESSKPELRITMTWEDFIELVSGEKDPQTMFMNGRLKMTGNLVKALSIQNVIGETIAGLKASL